MRPVADCYCASIPQIQNKTPILILQHRRERPHPFNTARMVDLSLANSKLIVDRNTELARIAPLLIQPGAGLLYPAANARELKDVRPADRPTQLVILDGTWHHAKTMYRDIAALHDLPKFKLSPPQPGNYRIRREPSRDSLSTVEATVAAMAALEPETHDIAKMIDAFNAMIDRQLAYPKTGSHYTHQKKRNRTPINIPSVVLGGMSNIVVAYGESVGFERQRKSNPKQRLPVFWVAQRLVSGECFQAAIRQPGMPMTSAWLKHLELTADVFIDAWEIDEFQRRWSDFLRVDDTLVVYNHSTLRLLQNIDADFVPSYNLKTVNFDPHRKYSTLDQFFAATGSSVEPPILPGRAGKRLAQVKSFVHFLNRFGIESTQSE